jgi:succinate dehydrogenase, hydrophobic membrane anchor protein
MDYKAPPRRSKSDATGHFWYQRLTALALLPLSVWLLLFLNLALHAPYAETLAWLTSPVHAAALAVWSIVAIYHAALGLQVVLEDYVSTLSLRRWAIRVSYLIFSLLGIAALAAIIYILYTQGNYGLRL